MPVSRRGAATTIAAAVVLFAGSTLGSYAANGGPLLLGKSNTASKTTKLKTTGNGAALKLKSKSGKAPLKVSNSTKVTKLNADLVDGLDGEALRAKAFVYTVTAIGVPTTFASFELPDLPPGRYLVSYSVSVSVNGGPGSGVACFLIHGAGPSATIPIFAAGVGGGNWFINGSGYVDTTTNVHRFTCQEGSGDPMTIPSNSQFPARLVFTPVDDVTTRSVTGVGADGVRPGE